MSTLRRILTRKSVDERLKLFFAALREKADEHYLSVLLARLHFESTLDNYLKPGTTGQQR